MPRFLVGNKHVHVQKLLGSLIAFSVMFGCQTTKQSKNRLTSIVEGCGEGATFQTSTSEPILKNGSDLAPDRPVGLVYYAIDTAEPFMKMSVLHELRSLKQSCTNENTNWVAFTNSFYFVGNGIYIQCKNGQLTRKPYPQDLRNRLESKRAALPHDIPEDFLEESQFTHFVSYPPDRKPVFKQFPLAHPEFLHDILAFVADEVFSPGQVMFLHIKSHGSKQILLTGLDQQQTDNKSECQNAQIQELLGRDYSSDEIEGELLGEVGLGEVGLGEVGLGEVGLGEVGLGEVGLGEVGLGEVGLGEVGLGEVGLGEVGLGEVGLGEVGLGEVGLGEVGLGEVGLGHVGLGATSAGLGSVGLGTHGLGTNNHFGAVHNSVLQVLRRLTTSRELDIGFVMFESCESNVGQKIFLPTAFNRLLPKVHGYYSAGGSLWYRNLDWDRIFSEWADSDHSPLAMRNILQNWTQRIPVVEVVE